MTGDSYEEWPDHGDCPRCGRPVEEHTRDEEDICIELYRYQPRMPMYRDWIDYPEEEEVCPF